MFFNFCEEMQDIRRPAQYTEYPRKPVTEEDDSMNILSIVSLVCGLVSVLLTVISKCAA